MKRTIATLLIALPLMMSTPAHAWENKPADDTVSFNLSAEDWVSTKTAKVSINVEAAVTGKTSGKMRDSMIKAVNHVVKANWRLTNFYRNQDKTGMERWSASYEARLPEAVLSGLNEQAKKNSKAGMQLRISNVDFSPTLAERQNVMNSLRTEIYKQANAQLADLNKAMDGRTYRISKIRFSNHGGSSPRAYRSNRMKTMALSAPVADAVQESMPSMERSEKVYVNAYIEFASMPPKEIKE